MNPRMILFALHEMNEIGWITILKITQFYTDLKGVLNAKPSELTRLGIRAKQAQTICDNLNEDFVNGKLSAYERQGVQILTIYDEEYPTMLWHTAEPPWVLYCKGNLDLLLNPLIAIVGTRVPTVYGKNVAQQFGEDLARAGFTVVSGLARGIDSCAHIGALKQQASTIAILGSGVDVVYPPENGSLYREIASKGLLISEFPLGTPALPGLFPLRNRIISGLSLGTLVVEAALKSGSIITAHQAIDEGRDVFIIPGPINSPKSQGVFTLMKSGAKIVICPEDIFDEYKHFIEIEKTYFGNANDNPTQAVYNADEQQIIDILVLAPATFDSLLEETQTNFGHLHTILLSLVMKLAINQLPGSIYSIR
ncbi:DNA-protecting protein DprA [Paenibacillus psychroresistens]|uniref:DNA-protecting protein DprA n=1 Tax=Paenibacillus psychroresistens TaxID=1778678 RepID=A0A6B8RJJ2_9BACL|nr:DNA-processing protein DprA [Paenibacillus psychroresistens]QGQ96219.1 DNA-protecting protein DprA [Paenibacillus psychroresistens]